MISDATPAWQRVPRPSIIGSCNDAVEADVALGVKTLGLNISGYISSAALANGPEVLGAACEERFSRVKRDRAFPSDAIRDAMARAGAQPQDLDAVAVAWNPARNLGRNLALLSEANRTRAKYLAYVPNELALAFGETPTSESTTDILGHRIRWVDHHLAHAASTCFTSPWERAAVVTIDAFGEEDSLTIGHFEESRITTLERIAFPHSVGSFYSYLTEFLGFRSDSDEYKVMALGAYADPEEGRQLLERVDRLYRIERQGGRLELELDLNCFEHYLFHRPYGFQAMTEALGMSPRRPTDDIEPRHFALAWALQRSFERILDVVLEQARETTGETNICLSGGCFMNSLANGRLERDGAAFDGFHITPYPDDSGTAVGAALYVNLCGRDVGHRHLRHNFFGPEVTPEDAVATITRRKLASVRLTDVGETIASLVADGLMVGYAAGRMEFGQRALGHRSIFADPRDPEVRAKLNEHVKRREWFRPYAASVLSERLPDVFDAPAGFEAWFMEKVRTVRPEWSERIRGLVHADGTVRIHGVDTATNPLLHAILVAFEAKTGVPLLLNTSFNVAGMPIVCTADDALDCFFACGLDAVVVGNRLVRKATVVAPGDGAHP
jgi:carbamoyltransferase